MSVRLVVYLLVAAKVALFRSGIKLLAPDVKGRRSSGNCPLTLPSIGETNESTVANRSRVERCWLCSQLQRSQLSHRQAWESALASRPSGDALYGRGPCA